MTRPTIAGDMTLTPQQRCYKRRLEAFKADPTLCKRGSKGCTKKKEIGNFCKVCHTDLITRMSILNKKRREMRKSNAQ